MTFIYSSIDQSSYGSSYYSDGMVMLVVFELLELICADATKALPSLLQPFYVFYTIFRMELESQHS